MSFTEDGTQTKHERKPTGKHPLVAAAEEWFEEKMTEEPFVSMDLDADQLKCIKNLAVMAYRAGFQRYGS